MMSMSSNSHCVTLSPDSTATSGTSSFDRQLTGGCGPADLTGSLPTQSTTAGTSDSSLLTKDLKSLEFFYNIGIDYFRQCIQHPPPNLLSQSQQGQPVDASRHDEPTPASQTRYRAPIRDFIKETVQSSDGSSPRSTSPDAYRLPSFSPVQSRKAENGSVTTRSSSQPSDEGAGDGRVDMVRSQKLVDAAEELTYISERRDEHRDESVVNHADLVYHCTWSSACDSSLDSGCMSDRSSGSGDSPSTTISPHHSLANDCSTSDDEYALTKHLERLEMDRNVDDKPPQITGDVPAPVRAVMSAQTNAAAQSVPRYVRPMREIPPRFQRLLAAEADRVVRLCQRLNGSPLYSATTPSDAARQQTNDSRTTLSDASRDIHGAYVEKAVIGHTSPLIYVTAQSSGLPVYPPVSEVSLHVNGCHSEVSSYVVPVGVADASQGCGNGLPAAAAAALTPSAPMLLPNPVYYYPSASVPPPDVGSPFSCVIPTAVVGGCPQSGMVPTSRKSAAIKNVQSDQLSVVTDVGVFQSTTNDVYNSYYYNSPGHELIPCCSLQLMHA